MATPADLQDLSLHCRPWLWRTITTADSAAAVLNIATATETACPSFWLLPVRRTISYNKPGYVMSLLVHPNTGTATDEGLRLLPVGATDLSSLLTTPFSIETGISNPAIATLGLTLWIQVKDAVLPADQRWVQVPLAQLGLKSTSTTTTYTGEAIMLSLLDLPYGRYRLWAADYSGDANGVLSTSVYVIRSHD